MNTQSYLFENKETIPDGLYLDLMNKLKLDFDTKPAPKPKMKDMNKSEIIFMLGKCSILAPERIDMVWLERYIEVADVKDLRKYCKDNGISCKKST